MGSIVSKTNTHTKRENIPEPDDGKYLAEHYGYAKEFIVGMCAGVSATIPTDYHIENSPFKKYVHPHLARFHSNESPYRSSVYAVGETHMTRVDYMDKIPPYVDEKGRMYYLNCAWDGSEPAIETHNLTMYCDGNRLSYNQHEVEVVARITEPVPVTITIMRIHYDCECKHLPEYIIEMANIHMLIRGECIVISIMDNDHTHDDTHDDTRDHWICIDRKTFTCERPNTPTFTIQQLDDNPLFDLPVFDSYSVQNILMNTLGFPIKTLLTVMFKIGQYEQLRTVDLKLKLRE